MGVIDRDILERELLDLGYDKRFVEYLLRSVPDKELTDVDTLNQAIREYCWNRVYREGEDIIKGHGIDAYTGAVMEAVGEGLTTVSEVKNYALFLLAERELDIDPHALLEDILDAIEE